MIKTILLFMIFPLSVFAMSQQLQLDMLNSQIAALEQSRAEKYAELKKCEQTTKGFKIAGLSTLAATGVGIYANIKLHQTLSKLRDSESGGASGGNLDAPGRIDITVDAQCQKMCCGGADDCDRDAFEEDCGCSQLCDACAE